MRTGAFNLLRSAGVAIAAILAGCASAPSLEPGATANRQPRADAADVEVAQSLDMAEPPRAEGVVCREEVRVGSHVARRRCFPRRDLEQMTRDAQEWLRSGGRRGGGTRAR